MGMETSESARLYPISGNTILLLQQLASRLQYLKLNFHMMEKFIFTNNIKYNTHHMKGVGFHIPHERLVSSFQSIRGLLCLQALTHLQALILPIDYSYYIHHKEVVLPNIKYLSLYDRTIGSHCNSMIKLDDVFHTYPHLVHLKVASQCTIIISNDNTKEQPGNPTYPDLRSLDLSVMDVQNLAYIFMQCRLPNLTHFNLATIVKFEMFKLEFPNHIIHSLNLDVTKIKNRLADWKIQYRISTTDCILKNINYIHFNRERIKVAEKDVQQNGRLRTTVEITCNKLLELKYQNHIIF
jgi:hypothetical protein